MGHLVNGLFIASFWILSSGKILINELAFMGSSYGRCTSSSTDVKPWVELYNSGSQHENLTGYTMTYRFFPILSGNFAFGRDCLAPVLQPQEYLQVCISGAAIEAGDSCFIPRNVGKAGIISGRSYLRSVSLKNSSGEKSTVTIWSLPPQGLFLNSTNIVWAHYPTQSKKWRFSGRATPGEVNSDCKLGDNCTDCPSLAKYNRRFYFCECQAGSSVIAADMLECRLCQAGRHNPTMADPYVDSCRNCSGGTYSHDGATECIPCPPGTYAPNGSGACMSCPEGMVTAESGATGVLDCICKKGSYASESGSCRSCGGGWTTLEDGARTEESCIMQTSTLAVTYIVVSTLVASIILCVTGCIRRKSIIRNNNQKSWLKIVESIKCTISLQYPLILMSAEDFLAMGQLHCLERCLADGRLRFLHTLDEIKAFTQSRHYIFFSHQWVAFLEPDPQNVQYACMKQALQALLLEKRWDNGDVYVWLDFFSIPQIVQCTKQLAINSLPIYAANASAFVIVAPPTPHKETGAICNLDTYKARLWCRAELMSHFSKGGTDSMYVHDGKSMQHVLDSWSQDSLFVFEGECTCCRLEHKNMSQCDKEYLVSPMLGLYIAVLLEHSQTLDRTPTYEFMISNENRMFPESFSTVFAAKRHDVLTDVYDDVKHAISFHRRSSKADIAEVMNSYDESSFQRTTRTRSLFPKHLMNSVRDLIAYNIDFSVVFDTYVSQGIADYQFDYRKRSEIEDTGDAQVSHPLSKDHADRKFRL